MHLARTRKKQPGAPRAPLLRTPFFCLAVLYHKSRRIAIEILRRRRAEKNAKRRKL